MNRFLIFSLTVFVIFNLLSCNQKEPKVFIPPKDTALKNTDSVSNRAYLGEELNQLQLYKLIDTALDYGDSKAYNKVSNYYLVNDMDESFLFPALIMANRYHEPAAYFDVYDILCNLRYDSHLEGMDSSSRSMALYYLLKSYELNFSSARFEVKRIFSTKGKSIPKSNQFIEFK